MLVRGLVWDVVEKEEMIMIISTDLEYSTGGIGYGVNWGWVGVGLTNMRFQYLFIHDGMVYLARAKLARPGTSGSLER